MYEGLYSSRIWSFGRGKRAVALPIRPRFAVNTANVTVSTGGYFVWRVGPAPLTPPEHWQANQSIDLTSHDGAAMLKLVGELQQKGLAIGQLGWRLSDAATRAARAEARRGSST